MVSKLPDDFSEMIYCGALFRAGHPRFVLPGLYYSSASAINSPCLLLSIQRHISLPVLQRAGMHEAQPCSIAAEGDHRRKNEGKGYLGMQAAGAHLGVMMLPRSNRAYAGSQGANGSVGWWQGRGLEIPSLTAFGTLVGWGILPFLMS